MAPLNAGKPWRTSWLVLILACVLLPPAGLLLVWFRPGFDALRKVAGSVVVLAWGYAVLSAGFGLRHELDGSGIRPIFTFYRLDARYAELEKSRAEQRSASQAPANMPPVRKTGAPPAPAYWTDFRGPHRDGRYDEMAILTTWPAQGLEKLWAEPIGGGYASFVAAAGRAFTIEQRRKQETVAAYDLRTGRELWANAWDGFFQESMGGDGPRATPAWNEGRIYALGALGELRCLDAETGMMIWAKNILRDNQAENLPWGMAASPLIVDGKVIVLPGGSGGKSVVAYDKLTGEPAWRAQDDRQAYTSPMLVTLAGRRQILVVSARRAMGLAPEDGTLLWEYPWTTEYDVNSAQPLFIGARRVFLSAGYGHGAAVLEVMPSGDRFTARTVWANKKMKNKFSGSVLHEGYIYGLDEAILACVSAETAELKWKGGHYGYGQVLLASGYLIVTTERGEVVLVKATPERHEEIAHFEAVSGKTWNNPAIAGGRLLVRNQAEMACFRVGRRLID